MDDDTKVEIMVDVGTELELDVIVLELGTWVVLAPAFEALELELEDEVGDEGLPEELLLELEVELKLDSKVGVEERKLVDESVGELLLGEMLLLAGVEERDDEVVAKTLLLSIEEPLDIELGFEKCELEGEAGAELDAKLDKLVFMDRDDEELVAAAPKPDVREVALLLDSVDEGLVVGMPELDEEALDPLA